MNAYFLHKPDGTPTEYSVCGECGKLARGLTNVDISQRCCTCYSCGKPLGKESGSHSLYHRECELVRLAAVDARRLEDATLVEGYDGPVFFEGGHGSYGEGYYESADELAEDDDFTGEFAHCCTSEKIHLDVGDILENLTEELYEDALEDLNGIAELGAGVAAFNLANSSFMSWSVDYGRKVKIRERGER